MVVRMLLILAGALSWATFASGPVAAQELLSNRSFESPVTPSNGNNFYTSIPSWTVINVTPATATPWNIIRPFAGYANNPTATPTGGAVQYLDINGAAGTIRQSVTISSQGMVDISGWFSVRDFSQALSGLTINVRDPGGNVVGTVSTSFIASDPIGLWKLASTANIPVAPGTYIFEVVIPDFANFDLASMVFKPAPTLVKSGVPWSDPVNGVLNPKLIPGGIAEYTISITTPADYSASNNTTVVTDTTPVNSEFIVADIGGAGSGPAAFSPGSSTLTYGFTNLSSATDNIDFSNNGGASWGYVPVADANGADQSVTTVRLRPQGAMAAGATAALRLRYRIK